MAKKTLRSAEADETVDRADEAVPTAGTNGVDTTPEAPKKRAPRKKATPVASDTPDAEAPPTRRSRAKTTETPSGETVPDEAPPPTRRSRAKATDAPTETSAPDVADAPADGTPRRRRTRVAREAEPVASSDRLDDVSETEAPPTDAPPRERRRTRQIDLTSDRPREERARGDRPSEERDERPAYDDEGGGRRKRKRNRNKNRSRDGQPQGGHPQGGHPQGGSHPQGGAPQGGHPGEPFEGMLELIGDKKFGFIRGFSTSLLKGDNDPFMPPPLIQKYNLRDGVRLKGVIKPGRKGAMQVTEVTEVMGVEPDEWADLPDFDAGLVIYPEEKLNLVTGPEDVSMRVVDLVAPLGKGQRALIVAPPRAGKTILLKHIAAGLSANHPEVTLVALLIDERPEEVTDFRRNTEATVFASSNDAGEDNHVRVATLAFEYSRRLVEQGKDVVVLLDSLTRLGRTFNLFGGNYSGRTMSGGLDARALVMPRKIFGSARNIEDGGSLTIVATALIETGSRMDEVIFEEFKGTGNSEIVLDRELSEKRIYPAINIRKSGTRNEERLVPDELVRQRHMLLRALNSRFPVEAMQALVKQIQLSPTNVHLLNELVPETSY